MSLHHSDHDGVVRIFVGHLEIVKRLLINYLDYITRHNFLYTRSVINAAQFFPYQECKFCMKVYAKEAQGIQNSIKLMLLHPGVSISNDTQTQKDKHGYNTDSNVLLWYS